MYLEILVKDQINEQYSFNFKTHVKYVRRHIQVPPGTVNTNSTNPFPAKQCHMSANILLLCLLTNTYAKHTPRMAKTHGGTLTRQISVTQAAPSRSTASIQRIKARWFKYAGLGLCLQNNEETV